MSPFLLAAQLLIAESLIPLTEPNNGDVRDALFDAIYLLGQTQGLDPFPLTDETS